MRLGLDIGGTKIEAVILDEHGEAIYRQRYATPKQHYEEFLQAVITAVHDAQANARQPLTVGLGIPGAAGRDGLIKNSNILVLNQQPFVQHLTQRLEMPVAVTNDANCFTLSEAIDGAGKGYGVVFGVILGTGCGGGLCVDGRLISGPNACAGEWGHNVLPHYQPQKDGASDVCYCGQTNCIESFISGSGLQRQYFQKFSKHDKVPDIISQMNAGNTVIGQLWDRYQDQVARSLAGIVNTLDPDAIVLGGGVSNIPQLYTGLQERIAQYVFGKQCCTPVVQARHGDSSGVRGAAWLGAQPH
ncbi:MULTISPECIES: ROK family protein [unclassified Klebsiella]|uniref:ROK family protein n=1 Tax=Enterobacteriaceae TaxID=543 RepID=UPI0015DC57AF|nr:MULTISPECIES: ROK family protein [unclassified Klebsiella]HAT3951993.1 ROK family protein [Kluyvera ascorbata]BBR59470.1 fructokinase [Klebsiella sp. WP4-W18-ESBL-05]BBS91193.1 fructokinase [Klebsiella sp. WP7-S18-CRE-02]BBS96215.1 fructokinase [Klebsiella sp. WP7-S18-CRE-03]BBT01247.1 fructokinase [Klebsiella sp. WP7-S18-ESBL-04]